MEWIKQIAYKKFPVLLLINLEGTLAYRTKGTEEIETKLDNFHRGRDEIKNSFYFRPGYEQLIKGLIGHKRA
jgi:hypothetical protein